MDVAVIPIGLLTLTLLKRRNENAKTPDNFLVSGMATG
jgi:hypothetical protein